jgi:hypothetical protein
VYKILAVVGLSLIAIAVFLVLAFPVGPVTDMSLVPVPPLSPDGTGQQSFPAGSDGYLILTSSSLLKLDAMREFIRHKRNLGLRVEAVSIKEIEKKYTSGERADRIRQYLKDNSNRLGLRYLLLVGDPDPADVYVKLPVSEELPPYAASVPSRSMGGTYALDRFDGEIGADGQHRMVILTGPNLQVLRSGKLRYWYVNCTKPGKIRLIVSRKDGKVFKHVLKGNMEEIAKHGIAIRSTEPIRVEAGDFVGFELPSEGAATVAAVNTPGMTCAQLFKFHNADTQKQFDNRDAVNMKALPLLQCSVYFEPEDSVGSLPSKMCWPMGTYNGIYGALLWDSCLSQCPTDAYYANLSDNWDENGNGFFGETFLKFFRYDGSLKGVFSPGDFKPGTDAFMPEILVGRIPFDNPETVAKILEKTVAYENSRDKEWRRHCLLGADPLAPDTDNYALCELIKRDICGPAGFKSTRFYTEHDFDGEVQSPNRYAYKPEALVTLDQIKQDGMTGYKRFSQLWGKSHPGLVIWSSHANTDICRNIITLRDESSKILPLPVTRRYVEALDDSHPAVVFAVACSVTQPEDYYLGIRKKRTVLEHDWEPRPNLGRELLKNGAVAVVAPSRSTWFRYGWDSVEDGGCLSLAYYFAQRFVSGENVAFSLSAALRDCHTLWGSELAEGQNLIGFSIYGDPSLKLGIGRKATVPLKSRPRPPELKLVGTSDDVREISIKVDGGNAVLEAGMEMEIDAIHASADGSKEWLEADGFVLSEENPLHGGCSFYSTPARHRRTALTLNFPLLPGQDITASFNCRYKMEPGLDYTVFEKSENGRTWEPLEIYTGASTGEPLFNQHNPQWVAQQVRFSTGEAPACLRFRYVTNDEYRKVPREGFYMDNFALGAQNGKVRYISCWQRVKRGKDPATFNYRCPGPGTYWFRARTDESHTGNGTFSDLYRLTVRQSRRPSHWRRVSTWPGLAAFLLAALGAILLIFSRLTVNRGASREV